MNVSLFLFLALAISTGLFLYTAAVATICKWIYRPPPTPAPMLPGLTLLLFPFVTGSGIAFIWLL